MRARDEDICPLRAITPLVNAVRRAAAAEGAPLVDFERWLEDESQRRYGHAILGREMFLDHVHPTIEVNGRLAMLLIDELNRQDIARVKSEWRERCEATAAQQVLAQLQPADHATAHRMVAKVLSWAGKIEEAGPAALAALAIEPEDRESLFIAGAYKKFLGHDREGNELYRRALEKEIAEHPEDVEARHFLAKTLLELGELDAARRHAQEALKLRPDSAEAQRLLEQLDP